MFWSIFFSSLALIIVVMVAGQLIANFVEKRTESTSESEE